MKEYTIKLDETVSEFFEEIALIAKRPVEDILFDGLSKQVEMIMRHVSASFIIEDEE